MLYGIKYQTKNESLTSNNSLQEAKINGKSKFVLNNLLSAMFVASYLRRTHPNIKYTIYELSPLEIQQVKKENIASSVEEFKAMVDMAIKKADQKHKETIK